MPTVRESYEAILRNFKKIVDDKRLPESERPIRVTPEVLKQSADALDLTWEQRCVVLYHYYDAVGKPYTMHSVMAEIK